MNDDPIAKALDLVPVSNDPKELVVANDSSGDEYTIAKENMDTIINVGTTALKELASMANASQDPRVYRVLTELIAAMTTANKEIISMKKTNSEIKEPESKSGPTTVQNNMFVGSTAELAKMLEGLKNNEAT